MILYRNVSFWYYELMQERYIKSQRDKLNKIFCISSMNKFYYMISAHDHVVARIIKMKDGWFVWNERHCFREAVKNFTEAITMIEEFYA